MCKLPIGIVFSIVPVLAQVSPLLPTQPLNIGEMTAPSGVSRYEARTDLERTAPTARTLYRWSIATMLAANAADVATSWSQQEANPVVGGGGTQFGATSMAIKTGFVATSLVIQHVAMRHRPDLYKKLAWLNFATSGVLGGVAGHNMVVR